jgi:hypothetical protein
LNNVGGNLDVGSQFNSLVHFNYVVIPSKFNTHYESEVVEGIEYEPHIKENVQNLVFLKLMIKIWRCE